ncbi:MAG: imelysin family protein [Lentisphaerales bacterium]|nr:imelysin family protein [Lentisphaerales bacterium]
MKYILLLLFSLSLLPSCKEGNSSKSTFDRQKMLADIGQKAIVPAFKKFADNCDVLADSLQTLKTDFTVMNLKMAQLSWKNTAGSWRRCELFNIAPFKNSYIKNKVATWPTKVSTLETLLSETTEEINAEFVDNRGSNIKGLSAIEYLLFDAEINKKLKPSSKYLDYLVALGQDLKNQSEKAFELWTIGEENALTAFTSKDDLDLGSSISMLVNEMIALTEKMHISKISKPLGKDKDGEINIESFEAWRSEHSKMLILENLNAIEAVYSYGLYTYLDHLHINVNQPLPMQLSQQFGKTKAALFSMTGSFELTAAKEPKKFEPLIEEMRKLLVLIKVDTANQLGITVTFNDNDGD